MEEDKEGGLELLADAALWSQDFEEAREMREDLGEANEWDSKEDFDPSSQSNAHEVISLSQHPKMPTHQATLD